MVQVGAQVAVTAQPGTGIILQQQQHKHTQGVPLERGACIGRATTLVKTAFVTDPDALVVPTAGMGTGQGQGTEYNPQIEMFARFKTKSSFHKTKRII